MAPPASLPERFQVIRSQRRESNGELLKAAEAAGFGLLLATGKKIRHRQNSMGRKMAIVVLGNSQWRVVRLYFDRVTSAVNEAAPGRYAVVDIPFK
jgi:hypothetical protein